MKKRQRPPMTVLITFDPPSEANFNQIRDFICDELESGGDRHPNDPLFDGLSSVHVSKPITTWRDPGKKKNKPVRMVFSQGSEDRG